MRIQWTKTQRFWCLAQGLANWPTVCFGMAHELKMVLTLMIGKQIKRKRILGDTWVSREIQVSGSVSKVLWKQSTFTCILSVAALPQNGRIAAQGSRGPQSLKPWLSGPSQKSSASPDLPPHRRAPFCQLCLLSGKFFTRSQHSSFLPAAQIPA